MSAAVLCPTCGHCNGECALGTDDFNRADDTDLGADWDEVAGDGEIASNQLVTSDADSIFIFTPATYPGVGDPLLHPGSLTVTVDSDTAGAEAKLIGGYLDEDNHVYALWTFEAGFARLQFYRVVAGVVSALMVDEFIIPGLGVGNATTLRFCWSPNKLHVDSESFVGPLTNPAAIPLPVGGNKAGVGTGVTGGEICFDDYTAEKTSGTTGGCPDCPKCSHCPDTQELCLAVSGMEDFPDLAGGGLWDFTVFNGTARLERGLTGITLTECAWGSGSSSHSAAVFLFYDDPDWKLRIIFKITKLGGFGVRQAVAEYEVNLGPELPDCSAFDCLPADFVSCGYDGLSGPDDCAAFTGGASVCVTSGDECEDCLEYCAYYAGPSNCCAATEIPPLFITILKNGLPYVTSEPLDEGPGQNPPGNPNGFEFSANSLEIVFQCLGGLPDGPDKYVLIFDGSTAMTFTIESCEPFLATGTAEISGDIYEVVITE